MAKLGEAIKQRKEFIVIDDSVEYKRCRVQTNRKGVVLRDLVKGSAINTKKQQVCRTGDFIVAEIDAKVGGYGFIPKELDGSIVSSHYFLFELNPKKIHKDYLRFLIITEIIQNQINSKGSTNYAAIRPQHVLDFDVPLPEIVEQKEIVKKLTSVFYQFEELTKELTAQTELANHIRRSILQEAVQGKLVPQRSNDEPASELLKKIKAEKEKLAKEKLKKEKPLPPIALEETPFELPKGWVWCRLGEISEIVRGSSPRPKGDPKYFSKERTDYPFIKIYDITNYSNGDTLIDTGEFLTKEGSKFGRRVDKGDIIIAVSGSGSVGKVSKLGIQGFIYDGLIAMKDIPVEIRPFIFIYLKTQSSSFIGSATGTSWVNLNTDLMKALLIPLPPAKECIAIVNRIEKLSVTVKLLELSVRHSKNESEQLLQAILHEAFNGQAGKYQIKETASISAES